MKKLFVLLLGIGSSHFVLGQGLEKGEKSCLQFSAAPTQEEVEAKIIVQNMLTKMGKPMLNLSVRACPQTQNAAVYCDSLQHLYILYNQNFLERLKKNAIAKGYPTKGAHQDDWVTIGLLAHELGHIINGHVYNPLIPSEFERESPKRELQADEFIGTSLAILGANLDEARMCIDALEQHELTVSHPPKAQRLKAIEKGWRSHQKPLPLTEAHQAFEQKAYERAYQILSHPAQDLEAMDCWILGELWRNGWGCRADTLEAIEYFEKAITRDSKCCPAYESLYRMLQNSAAEPALRALMQGAEQSCVTCQTELGWQYELIGEPKEAAQWYQKAANQDYPAAVHNLAGLYELGSGVTLDLAKAKSLYRKAAQSQYKPSQQRLETLTP